MAGGGAENEEHAATAGGWVVREGALVGERNSEDLKASDWEDKTLENYF